MIKILQLYYHVMQHNKKLDPDNDYHFVSKTTILVENKQSDNYTSHKELTIITIILKLNAKFNKLVIIINILEALYFYIYIYYYKNIIYNY